MIARTVGNWKHVLLWGVSRVCSFCQTFVYRSAAWTSYCKSTFSESVKHGCERRWVFLEVYGPTTDKSARLAAATAATTVCVCACHLPSVAGQSAAEWPCPLRLPSLSVARRRPSLCLARCLAHTPSTVARHPRRPVMSFPVASPSCH